MVSATSLMNITVRVQAQRAMSTLNALKINLDRITVSGTEAGGVMDAISGAALGFKTALGGASAEAANLSKSLALIKKNSGTLANRLLAIGSGAELAAPALAAMAVQVGALSRVMGPLAAQSVLVANSLKTMAKANQTAALTSAKADAIREQSAAKTAAAVSAAALKEQAAREKNAAQAAVGRAAVVRADQQVAAGAAKTSAAIVESESRSTIARERSAAAAAASAASIQVANSKIAASQAAAARAAGGAAAGGAIGSAAAAANSSLLGMGGTMDQMSGKMRSFGSKMQWVGRQLAVNFTAPLALIGGAAMVWANEQEKAWTRVKKVYGDGSDAALAEAEKVRGGLDMLSNYYGKNREEIYDVAEAWTSLGMTGGQLAKSVQNTVEVSLLGNMDLTKSTEALIAIQQQYQMTTTETTAALKDLNAIANQGPLELDGLVEGFSRGGAAAHAAGLSVAEFGGLLETLSPATGTATQAGNGLRSILLSITNLTPEASEMINMLGMSTEEWTNQNVSAIDKLKQMGARYQDLNDNQKIMFDGIVAGRYQLQRFGQVLATINDPMGEFQKALRATGTDAAGNAKSLAVWEKELSIIMESSPQKFAQMWQVIKNSLVDAFKPLIPAVLQFVTLIAKAAKWFANLSPATRQWIMIGALLLAILGPIIVVFSSLILAVGVLGTAFAAAIPKVLGFGRVLLWAATMGKAFKVNAVTTGLAKLSLAFGKATVAMQWVWTAFWLRLAQPVGAGLAAAGSSIMTGLSTIGSAIMSGFLVPLGSAIAAGMSAIGGAIMAALSAIAVAAGVSVGAVVAVIAVVAGVVAAVIIFRDEIQSALQGLWSWLSNLPAGFQNILIGISRGLAGIPQMVYGIMQSLAGAFQAGVRIAAKAMGFLPQVVQKAIMAVVRMLQSAARMIRNALSALNPFQRHSPSLVDNVVAGTAVIADQYGNLAASVIGDMAAARAAVQAFGGASAGLNMKAADIEYANKRAKVSAVDPGAARGLDGLRASQQALESDLKATSIAIKAQEQVIKSWQDRIDAADKAIEGMNKQLEMMQKAADQTADALADAQKRLDTYANAQITGEGAMSDAIFENQMAQKALRLEIMKMEDAGQTIDDVRDKYQKLQGDIDTLSGRRDELRAAGAGSDITGTYDAMIADLQAQQGNLATSGVSEIEKAQKQLDELARKGEMLDLENSLQFDPLHRQIEKVNSDMKEMPFDQIMAGVTREKAAVQGLTATHELQTKAIEAQQERIEQATDARDLMADAMELEQDKLDKLNEGQQAIQESLDEVTQAMDVTVQSADTVTQAVEEQQQAIEDASKALEVNEDSLKSDEKALKDIEKAADGAGAAMEGFGDIMSEGAGEGGGIPPMEELNYDAWADELSKKMQDAFGDMDLFKPIKDQWQKIKDWFADLPGEIGGWFASIGSRIGSDVAATFAPLTGFFSGLPGRVGGWLASARDAIFNWFTNLGIGVAGPGLFAVSQIADFFKDLPARIMTFVTQTIPQMANFFLNLPGTLLSNVSYAIGVVAGWFVTLPNKIVEAIQELIPKLIDFFSFSTTSLLDRMEGFWAPILNWWYGLPQRLIDAIFALGGMLGDFFSWVWNSVLGGSEGWFAGVAGWWMQLPGRFVGYLQSLPGRIADLFRGMWEFLNMNWEGWAAASFNWFTALPGRIIGTVIGLGGKMAEIGTDTMEGFRRGVLETGGNLWNWFYEHTIGPMVQGFKDYLGIASPSTLFAGYGKNIIQGMIDGIGTMGSILSEYIGGFIKRNVIDKAKGLLGISSPSTVFHQVGSDVGQGMANGIAEKAPAVENEIRLIGDRITRLPLPPVNSSKVLEDFSAAAGNAKSQIDVLSTGLTAYIDQATSTQNSQIALNDALAQGNNTIAAMPGNIGTLTQSLFTAGGQIDVNTGQGRQLHDTLKSVAGSYGEAGAAAITSALEQGQSHEQALQAAVSAGAGIKQSLIDSLMQMGLNAEQAQKLADQYLSMVREYWSQLMLNKTAAQTDLDAFKEQNKFIDVYTRVHQDPNYRAPGETTPPRPGAGVGDLMTGAQRSHGGWLKALAGGGWISGPGSSTSDDIMGVDPKTGKPIARVSDKEFVVNAKAAKANKTILELINAGRIKGFAAGGSIGGVGLPGGADIGSIISQITLGGGPKGPLDMLAQIPAKIQAATDQAKTILTTYGQATQGTLSTLQNGFVQTYENVKNQTLATLSTMIGQQITGNISLKDNVLTISGQSAQGQIQIAYNRDQNLLTGQANFNGSSIAGSVNLKDQTIGIHNQMASTVGTITQNSATQQGQIWTQTRDNLNNLSMNTQSLVTGNIQTLSNNLSGIYTNGILPTFNAFDPMLQTTQGWFQAAQEGIGAIWQNIQPGTADPSRFVINTVYNAGIREAWNKVNSWLGLPALDTFVAPFATGGLVNTADLVNPKTPRNISRGGKLNGPSSGDRTLFAGKGGEYVLTSAMAKDVGVDRLEAWRKAANSGKSVEGAASTFRQPVRALAAGGEVRPGVIDEVFKQLAPWKGSAYDYGGGGDPGYDCSGWTGAVHKILTGGGPRGRIWTTEVDFSQFGYKRGREGYWSMGVHNGGGGMNSHTAGTLDGHNFESGGAHNTSTWDGPAAGTVHPQFENQYYLPALGGVFQGSAGGGTGPTMSQRVEEAYESVMRGIRAQTPGPGGGVKDIPNRGLGKFDIETKRFLMSKAAEYDKANATMGNTAYDISAGVEQWRGTVKEVLGAQGRPLHWDELTLAQMQTESGGNPNAINNTDINAQNGTPSKGLMQVIDPTFQSMRDPRYPNDIWNPHANIAAALNWVVSRYGGPEGVWGAGHGYDIGGVLKPGITQAINATGKPEAVLTAQQWNNVGRIANGVTSIVRGIFNIGKSFGSIIGKILGKIFKHPIPTVPTDPGGGTPGGGTPGGGGPGTPGGGKPFWADAEAQMKTWTKDFATPIAGLEGVVANMPRKIGEEVIPELSPAQAYDKAAADAAKAAAAAAATRPVEFPAEWNGTIGKAVVAAAETAATSVTSSPSVSNTATSVGGASGTGTAGSSVLANAQAAQLNIQVQNGSISGTLQTPYGTANATATLAPGGESVNITFNGANLSFPNIQNPNDVKAFIDQLRTAAGR